MTVYQYREPSHVATLRSIARAIEVYFPSAADQLRGIANQLEREHSEE